MALHISTEAIARQSTKRPWLTVSAWVLILIVSIGLIATMIGDALTTDVRLTSTPESYEAQELIDKRFTSTGTIFATESVIVTSETLTVDDPAFESFVRSLTDALVKEIGDGLASSTSYFDEKNESLSSPDRHTAAIVLTIESNEFDAWRAMIRVLGRLIIAEDPDLADQEPRDIGWKGGEVGLFEIQSIRIPDGSKNGDVIIVRSESLTVDSVEYREFVTDLYLDIVSLGRDHVWFMGNYYVLGQESMVSSDRHATVLPIGSNENWAWQNVLDVIHEAGIDPRFEVSVTGSTTFGADSEHLSKSDLLNGELRWGLPIAILVLVIVFGALVATAIPLMISIVSIIVAIGIAAMVGQFHQQSIFLVNMVFMMGLAVGIDYSLFIVARFREERANGLPVSEAVIRSGATASRAVLVSGVIVVLALIGMLIVPHDIFTSLGTGAIIVVLVTVAASLTLTPAVLQLLGDRVDSVRVPFVFKYVSGSSNGKSQFWHRISGAVMGRPIVALILGAGLLIVMAVPVLDMNFGEAGVSTFPEDLESRVGYEALQRDFPAGLVSPARIVVDGDVNDPSVQDAIQRLTIALEADGSFGKVSQDVAPDGSLIVLNTPIIGGEAQSEEAMDALVRLRNDIIPVAFAGASARALVAGETAFSKDTSDQMLASMFVVIPFVLVLSFVLLILVFRSIVVPVKAIIMNLLSVGAAYGLMVFVFIQGNGNEIFGFQQVDMIESWVPLFLFSVLFGLSMDYHVFMLSRIREHFIETGDNTESVAFGLQSTGRLITSAALIMMAVFAGFAAGSLVMFQQMGFGLAVAVFIDATIIRSVLVPASMKLLGNKNWYLPKWLEWVPNLSEDSTADRGSGNGRSLGTV